MKVGDKRLTVIVVNVSGNGLCNLMSIDDTVMDLCSRIERMCRYAPLDDQEVVEQSIRDRGIVEGLYVFYRNKGRDENVAARMARVNAIRLLLAEVLS